MQRAAQPSLVRRAPPTHLSQGTTGGFLSASCILVG